MKTIDFSDLTPAEQQAWCDFCLKEICRHQEDVNRVCRELAYIAENYGVVPRKVGGYVDTWIEVAPEKGTSAPETSTETTQSSGKNTQYDAKGAR